MGAHLLHLLKRAFSDIPSLVSSNWAATFVAIGIFLFSQMLILIIRGWPEMKRQWKESVLIGVSAVLVGWLGL